MSSDPAPFEPKQVEFIKSAAKPEHFLWDGLPQVAFVGRSNVGKSSLLNVLVNRKRLARVSSTPGLTQLVNYFLVNGTAYFVDLPGYGFARAPLAVRSTWEKMITGFLQRNPSLRVVVALFDIRRDFTEEDSKLLDWLNHYKIPYVAVLTKADKFPRSKQMQALKNASTALASHAPAAIHLFSAETRIGREELLTTLAGFIFAPSSNLID